MAKKEQVNEEITSSVTGGDSSGSASPQNDSENARKDSENVQNGGENVQNGGENAQNGGEIAQGEVVKKTYDPWQDMREIYIPMFSRTEQRTLEVGVNDRTYFVPKEQTVLVPMPVWEVVTEMIERKRKMEEEAKKSSGTREMPVRV
ncbi:MAG: hypothetical protein IJS41_11935 [Clostridia bacterium]|nr:hypothetical protein [Clostridia bacterium]